MTKTVREHIQRGRLRFHGVKLEAHERATIEYFLNLGKNVELIRPSLTPKMSNPDFWMDGLVWEAKSPTVGKLERISKLFQHASSQSVNVIFDLRRQRVSDDRACHFLQKMFRTSRRVHRLMIIRKGGQLENYIKT